MSATVLTRLRRHRACLPAAVVLLLVVALALAAPLLPLPDPGRMDPALAGRSPEARWDDGLLVGALGTDALGRDLLSRVAWGSRVSLLVGLVAAAVSVVIGVGWGAVAGFSSPRVDELLMRIVDALYALPLLFVVILLVALLREHSAALRAAGIDRLVLLYLVIGAISWLTMARVVRGQVLSLRGRDFVLAARALGLSEARILVRHVLPQLAGLVAVYLTLTVPRVVLLEAFLSYLGLGVEPPEVSWGLLASEGMESLTAVGTAWWLIVAPGVALTLTLWSFNALGDALRDALDPRLPS